jgi:outer membrane lipoprotein-sorting protein
MTMCTLGSAAVPVSAFAVACLLPASPRAASDDILARSRAMYAALKSYADSGTVVYEYGTNSVSRHTFKTYYRAPRNFYFEFVEDKADGGSRWVIWCDGGDFQAWASDTGIRNVYPPGQGAAAFLGATYPSLGSATQIASLLFAKAGLNSTLVELTDMAAAGTEQVGGRLLQKLSGIARGVYGATGHVHNVRRTSVWIDPDSLVVRKIFEDTPNGTVAGSMRRITTTFEPQANPALDDSRFKFVVPSLQKHGADATSSPAARMPRTRRRTLHPSGPSHHQHQQQRTDVR